MTFTPEFQHCVDDWRNTDDYNVGFHSELTLLVNKDPVLKAHRDFVESAQFGFGDRAFHWLYWLLVQQMPQDFTFLEVGVFKGQVLSLVALCAKQCAKNATVFGVTTLQPTCDVRCKYPAGDYASWIAEIHNKFSVPQPLLIVGRSDDPKVIQAVQLRSYDLVLIDAGHDYKDVVNDIGNYAGCVKVGGILLMDDSSIGRLNIGSLWPGLEDVAQAVKDTLDKDERFKFLMCCGHLNVFERAK